VLIGQLIPQGKGAPGCSDPDDECDQPLGPRLAESAAKDSQAFSGRYSVNFNPGLGRAITPGGRY
jgi:hypothetical protein